MSGKLQALASQLGKRRCALVSESHSELPYAEGEEFLGGNVAGSRGGAACAVKRKLKQQWSCSA